MPRKDLAIVLALLCSGVLTVSGPAQADRRAQPPRRDPLGELDLTAAQAEEIKTLKENHHASGLKMHKERARLENRLEGLLLADDPAEEEILRLVEEVGIVLTRVRMEQRDRMLLHRPPRPPKEPRFERDAHHRNR